MDETIVPQFEKHLHHLIRQHGSIEDLEWFVEYVKSRNMLKDQVESLQKQLASAELRTKVLQSITNIIGE